MSDMILGITLKADGSGLVGEVKASTAELGRLGQGAAEAAGKTKSLTAETERLGADLAAVGGQARTMQAQQAALASGWRINRIGLMELQAAGINSFQALAAGMDPLHVAMFESTQVLGALVQGGVLASGVFRGLLGAITPIAPALIVAVTAIGSLIASMTIWKAKADDGGEATKAYREAIEDGKTAEDLFTQAIKAGNEAMLTRQQILDQTAQKQHESNAQIAQGVVQDLQQQLADATRRQQLLRGAIGINTSRLNDPYDQTAQELLSVNEQVKTLTANLHDAQVALVNLKSPYISGGQFAADAEAAAESDRQMIEAIGRGHDALDQHLKDQWESEKQAAADRDQFILDSQIELMRELNAELEENKKHYQEVSTAVTKALFDEVDALAALDKQGASLTQSLMTPQERYNDSLRTYQQLLDAGAISQETFNRAVKAAGDTLKSMDPLAQELAQDLDQAFDRIGTSITDMALNGQDAFLELQNIGLSVVSELMQAFLKLAIMNPIENALTGGSRPVLGDILDSLFGVAGAGAGSGAAGIGSAFSDTASRNAAYGGFYTSEFHEGGVVGRGGRPRVVSPDLFDGAPRFHSGGLVAGEVPIIAKKGEVVGWPGQLAQAYGGGDVEVIINNYSGQPATATQQQSGDGRRQIVVWIGSAVADDIKTGGPISRQMQATYGLSRG